MLVTYEVIQPSIRGFFENRHPADSKQYQKEGG
jgi:hypothetical protein